MISEIQRFLKKKSNKKVKDSVKKFIPTSNKSYGVKIPELNKLVKKYKKGGFELIQKLWNSGSFEEQILASKILGKLCRKYPNKTLKFIKKSANNIKDWAVCDTLGTQSIKDIIKLKQKEIFDLVEEFIKSKNLWKRRFALVLLINYKKDKLVRKEIEKILDKVKNDKEYYVRKAVVWLRKELEK